MKPVYVVEVGDDNPPALPETCVVCRKSAGETLGELPLSDEHSRVEFYLYGLTREPAQGTLLRVPVHDRCARAVRNAFLRQMLLIVLAAAIIAATAMLMDWSIVLSVGVGLIAVTPWLYRLFTTPVPMEFWRYGRKYVLVFEDRSYADAVARRNRAQVMECANAYEGLPRKLESSKKGRGGR